MADLQLEIATKSLEALIVEAGLKEQVQYRREPEWDDESHYAFVVYVQGSYPGANAEECSVLVPPLDVEQLKNSFVRLYVEGNSWLWRYAVPQLHGAITGDWGWRAS